MPDAAARAEHSRSVGQCRPAVGAPQEGPTAQNAYPTYTQGTQTFRWLKHLLIDFGERRAIFKFFHTFRFQQN